MTRGRAGVIASSPVLVGAITTLIVILAVFLAYNANNGLPFVPTYRVSVLVPNANTLVKGNDARIGGVRVGIVEKIEQLQDADTGEVYAKVDLKLDKSAEPCRRTRPWSYGRARRSGSSTWRSRRGPRARATTRARPCPWVATRSRSRSTSS